MRKLFLLFMTITLGLSLTSCLEGGSQNFTEVSVVYISQHQGMTYGKTLSGRVITSDKIKLMVPNTFKIFSYSWDESYGFSTIGNLNAYNVSTGGDVIDVKQTTLNMTQAPEVTTPVKFNEIRMPAYDEYGVYFDDYWLFEYTYMGKEGETPYVTFHKRDADSENPQEIIIDVRLQKLGEPKEGATEKLMGDIIAVNMAPLRSMYLNSTTESIRVKFYNYAVGSDTPVASQNTYTMKKKTSSDQ